MPRGLAATKAKEVAQSPFFTSLGYSNNAALKTCLRHIGYISLALWVPDIDFIHSSITADVRALKLILLLPMYFSKWFIAIS